MGFDRSFVGAYGHDDRVCSYPAATALLDPKEIPQKTAMAIIVDKEEYETDPDEFMMLALDAGAEDFNEEEDSYEILTNPDDFSQVREALEKEGVPMAQAEVTMIPQNYVELTDENDIKMFNRILDLLDEDDDVQAVWHNWDMPDED